MAIICSHRHPSALMENAIGRTQGGTLLSPYLEEGVIAPCDILFL